MNDIDIEVDLIDPNIDACMNIETTNTNQVNNNNNNNEEDELHFYEFGAHFQYASLYDKLLQLAEKQNHTHVNGDLLGIIGNINQQSRNACKPKSIRDNNNNNNIRKNEQLNEPINDVSSHTIDNNNNNKVNCNININNNNVCVKKEPANNIIKNIQQKEKRGYLNLLSKNVVTHSSSHQDRNNITNTSAIKKRIIYNTKLTSSNRSSNCSNSKIISNKTKIKSVSENKRKQTIAQSIPSISFQKRTNYSTSQHKTKTTKALISPPKNQLSVSNNNNNNNNFSKQHSKLNTASLSNPKKTSPKAKSALTGSIIGSNNVVSSKQTIVKSHLNKESKLKLQNDNNTNTNTNSNSNNTSSRKKLLNGPAFSRNIKNKNVLKYNINFKNNNTINQQSLTYNNNNNNTKMNNQNNNNNNNNNNINQNELLIINNNNNNNQDKEDTNKESNSAMKASTQKKTSLKQKLLLFNNNIKQKPRSQEKPVKSIELNISNYSSNKTEKSFKIKNSFLTKNQSINIHSSISSRKNTNTNTNNMTNEYDMKKRSKQLIKKSILNNIAPIQSSSKKISSRNGMTHSNARTITKASGNKDDQKKIQFLNYKNTKSVSKNKTSNYTHNRPTKSKKQQTQLDSGILNTKCNSSSSNVTNKNKITKNKQYL